jgi:dephospho-CoA kinase
MSTDRNIVHRIGIAGFMGSGKSTCAALCAGLTGMRLINADAEAKLLMENDTRITDEIMRIFGQQMFAGGGLNFRTLGTAAFASVPSMQALNAIVHPLLIRCLRDLVFSRPGPSILDAALIPLWHIEDWFDRCVWVSAPRQVRSGRLEAKTGLPPDHLRQRMLVQETLMAEPPGPPWEFIDNSGTLGELSDLTTCWLNF